MYYFPEMEFPFKEAGEGKNNRIQHCRVKQYHSLGSPISACLQLVP